MPPPSDKDDPADVARDGMDALLAGKDQVVAGSTRNKLQTAAAKVLPEISTSQLPLRTFTDL